MSSNRNSRVPATERNLDNAGAQAARRALAMIRDLQARFAALGFKEGSNAAPGDFVIERAFVG